VYYSSPDKRSAPMSGQRVIAVMVVMAEGQSFEVVPAPPHGGSDRGQLEVEGLRRLRFHRDQYIRSYVYCVLSESGTPTHPRSEPVGER